MYSNFEELFTYKYHEIYDSGREKFYEDCVLLKNFNSKNNNYTFKKGQEVYNIYIISDILYFDLRTEEKINDDMNNRITERNIIMMEKLSLVLQSEYNSLKDIKNRVIPALNELECLNEKLKKQIEHLMYRPGGPGYEKALEEFNRLKL